MADTEPTPPVQRRRKTSTRVLVTDRIARWVIRVGGIGTIVAVLTVGVYLVWVAAPLFFPSSVQPGEPVGGVRRDVAAPPTPVGSVATGASARMGVNDYETLAWRLLDDGSFEVTRLDTGEVIDTVDVDGPDAAFTAFALHEQSSSVALGYAEGTVRLGALGFNTGFVDAAAAPESVRTLDVGATGVDGALLYERVSDGQFRTQRFSVSLEDPAPLAPGRSIGLLDLSIRPNGPILAAVTEDGSLHVRVSRRRRNMLTGQTTVTFSGGEAPISAYESRGAPRAILLSGVGDTASLVWEDGQLDRYDTRDPAAPTLVETIDLTPRGAELTALRHMIGKTSIVAGDSEGDVTVWFRVKPDSAGGDDAGDGSVLVAAHVFTGRGVAATALGPSHRSRLLSIGYADGGIAVVQVTAENDVGHAHGAPTSAGGGGAVRAITLSPKESSAFGLTDSALVRWGIDARHAEVTARSLLLPVWYEGAEGPEHVWQSSSGTDDFEPKLGLMPLIFGTVKATVYSMVFGAPLALLAALYTSEFLSPTARGRIKPTVEMMASLPSVVLGFLAALIFAPFIENVVPQTLAFFATFPLTLLAGAHLVPLLPERALRRAEFIRLPVMLLCLPLAMWFAWRLGPVMERTLFAGDIKAWLDGQRGTGAGGWTFLLLPVCAVLVAFAATRFVRPILRTAGNEWSRLTLALVSLGVFVAGVLAAIGLAAVLGQALAACDLDPRGSLVGTYVQRNALVVGFVMGFAIIPIIYTLAEDALSSVPEHLRSASLGAGATQWQTATRVVIPVAMSGLFSAVMIGFGRAVGETMIVLMAAGNTPVMEWNIFNGFRTLSANIAVELPEAVRGSTHYRVLFLAALSLFIMTFLVNTVAEVVRQRFRKRAFQL